MSLRDRVISERLKASLPLFQSRYDSATTTPENSGSLKRRFPWVRLFIGAYFSFASILALLRIATMRHISNPYLKFAAITMFLAGAALLGSGILAAVDWKNSR